jgi:hypothetical protein
METKICQVDDNPCKRDAQALCFHCSKNLCRIHLLQHAQLIEEKTQVELNLLADKFNELSSRFKHIPISANILEKPFEELEKWSADAHKNIDQIVENKRREMNETIESYRTVFNMKNEEQIKKINDSKKLVAELTQEADASRKQMDELQASITEAEKYLQSLDTHTINVINPSPICLLDLETRFFDYQLKPSAELKNFKITYIRLNGTIRNYYVKTNKNGLMSDLKYSFVRQYNLLEALIQIELNSNRAIDHQPKSDFILPVDIYNHRARQHYNDDTKLADILDNNIIVFYETPYSLVESNNSQILMPCRFKHLLSKTSFGFPIYLSVPRNECQGQDVLNALHNTLGIFFPLNPENDRNMYNATIIFSTTGQLNSICKALNDVLEDSIVFTKASASLEVGIHKEIVDVYENNKVKYEGFE